MRQVAERLSAGEADWFTALGTSMTPAIKAVQRVRLRPVEQTEPLGGLVVLSQVQGRFWLHRVTAEDAGRVRIAADNGMVNGWTPRALVFGVVIPNGR